MVGGSRDSAGTEGKTGRCSFYAEYIEVGWKKGRRTLEFMWNGVENSSIVINYGISTFRAVFSTAYTPAISQSYSACDRVVEKS
jgi:hypothetical protein